MPTLSRLLRPLALVALVLATGSCDQAHRLTGPSGAPRMDEAPQLDSVAPAAQTLNAFVTKGSTGAITASLEGLGYYNGGGAAWFEYGTDPVLASPSTTPLDSVTSVQRVLHRASTGPLVRDAIYYFRLVVRTPQGTRQGAIRQFRAGAPDAPTGFAVVLDSLDYSLDLSWAHDGINVRTWTILRRPIGETAWTKVTQFLTPEPRAFVDLVLNPLAGGAYEYKVLACNQSFCSESPVQGAQAAPLQPATGLTATPVGGAIQLDWQKGPYGGMVRVLRRASTTQTFTLLAGVPHTQRTYTDTAVTAGQTYFYKVEVCARQNSCLLSEAAGATAGGGPGAVPGPVTGAVTNLMKMTDGTGRVQATLNGTVVTNGVDATAWMEYGTDPGLAGAASTPPVPISGASASVPVARGVSGLTRDAVYYYRLVAEADSVRYYGQIRSFRAGAPTAPTSFAATFELAVWAVALTWAHDGGGDTQVFSIERRRLGQDWGQILRVSPAGRKTSDAAFSVLTAYDFEYRIFACNRIACSAPVVAGPVHTPALLPSQLTAVQSGTGASVQWENDAPGARTVSLYRRNGADSVRLFHSDVGTVQPLAATGSYLDQNVPAGTYAYYLILCARGECATSNEATVVLGASGSAPVAVTGQAGPVQKMTDGSGRVSTSVQGSVDANGLETKAWLQYGLSPTLAGAASTAQVSAGFSTSPRNVSLPLSGLLRDTTYYFRVHAQNAAGTSAGAIHSVWTGGPNPVTNLTASMNTVGTDYVHVRWTHDGANLSTFLVERRLPGGGAWTKVAQPHSGSREYLDFNGATFHGATIEYRVSACNAISCSAPVSVSILVP